LRHYSGALDAAAAALVTADTRTRAGDNRGSSSSTASASASSAYDDASDMHILCWILRHFSDIPDLAKALALREDAAHILTAAAANVARCDATGAANGGARVPGEWRSVEIMCTLAHAMLPRMRWRDVLTAVEEGGGEGGLLRTTVREGMVKVRVNPDCPGAPQALAIRVVGAVNAAALGERKRAADTGDAAGAARVLDLIADLEPWTAALRALSRDNTWKHVHAAHAKDYVGCDRVMLLILSPRAWERLQGQPRSVHDEMEAVLKVWRCRLTLSNPS